MNAMTRQEEILRIFPDYMRDRWEKPLRSADKLQEIRLGVGRPVRFLIAGEEFFLSCRGNISKNIEDAWYITEREMEETLKKVCHYSMYAFENEIRQGFLTVPGGHRIGVAGQVIMGENGCIRNMSHIRFLNIRISHEILGVANPVMPYLYERGRVQNTLLISPPGCGEKQPCCGTLCDRYRKEICMEKAARWELWTSGQRLREALWAFLKTM